MIEWMKFLVQSWCPLEGRHEYVTRSKIMKDSFVEGARCSNPEFATGSGNLVLVHKTRSACFFFLRALASLAAYFFALAHYVNVVPSVN